MIPASAATHFNLENDISNASSVVADDGCSRETAVDYPREFTDFRAIGPGVMDDVGICFFLRFCALWRAEGGTGDMRCLPFGDVEMGRGSCCE
jgi:hypothetical protein